MPPGPAPSSLVHLKLIEGTGCDLALRYLAWRTENTVDVELCYLGPPQHYLDTALHELSVGITDLAVVLPNETETGTLRLRDAEGRTIVIRLGKRLGNDRMININAFYLIVDTLSLVRLRALTIDGTLLDALLDSLPRSIAHLTLSVYELTVEDARRASLSVYPWESLECMASLPDYFPQLESLAVEVRPLPHGDGPSVQAAQGILNKIASFGSHDLPVVRICGFSKGTVDGATGIFHELNS
ncbi:hypothetical protein AURDEDRAFT_166520 [Auricularia subglabra TFB-10046 SS5]|nr:hypothetical protein AURDEDRAFT_166520 [Auricularia subglabra TFB-10046 SS5]